MADDDAFFFGGGDLDGFQLKVMVLVAAPSRRGALSETRDLKWHRTFENLPYPDLAPAARVPNYWARDLELQTLLGFRIYLTRSLPGTDFGVQETPTGVQEQASALLHFGKCWPAWHIRTMSEDASLLCQTQLC